MFRAVPTPDKPLVLAVTGASGAPYAVRLLELLAKHRVTTWLLISSHGWRLLAEECGIENEAALRKATG
jgi:4-hydroxy-3-polyprenylbenzoate decarboxylase